jgi:hypothetical protein
MRAVTRCFGRYRIPTFIRVIILLLQKGSPSPSTPQLHVPAFLGFSPWMELMDTAEKRCGPLILALRALAGDGVLL